MGAISVAKYVRHPSAHLRRRLLFGDVRRDSECMHAVAAYSTGKLRRMPLSRAFPEINACECIAMRKPQSRVVGWALDLHELAHLLSVEKHIGAAKILEVGTFDGFSALNMAANLRHGGIVCTVDLPPGTMSKGIPNACDAGIVGSQFRGELEEKAIRQLWADSTQTDWSAFGGPFDLILVDGCHEYEYVKSDTANALRNLAPGGVILWHDYGEFPGVSRAVDEAASGRAIFIIAGTRLACYRDMAPVPIADEAPSSPAASRTRSEYRAS